MDTCSYTEIWLNIHMDDHHFWWILSTDNHHLDYITKLFKNNSIEFGFWKSAADDSENFDLILHMYVCMYVCILILRWVFDCRCWGWRGKEGTRRINWVFSESWVLIRYDDLRSTGNDFVVWREENFATWWIWLVRLIALEWFAGLVSECFAQMAQMICEGSSVELVQLKSQDPPRR
jgi:hypothetical protein